jgi:hypothetical protein
MTGEIGFFDFACAAAEIGLAIPVVRAKVRAMANIIFFMVSFSLLKPISP